MDNRDHEWDWLIIWGGLTCCSAPWCSDAVKYFKAGLKENDISQLSFWLVAISTFCAWVFAKSIYNASVLGGRYGIMGGIAYASWYTSFFCVALSVYRIRRKGFKSFPEAINARYGPLACITYCLAILYRLEQEVWSNAIVVAGFYGDQNSWEWWTAASVCTVIPCVYVFVGGLQSSLATDFIQGLVMICFLLGILIAIGVKSKDLNCGERPDCNLITWNPVPGRSPFSLEGGQDLVLVGLLQGCLSYGFFDPVLTDRAFNLEPSVMFKAYMVGGFLSAIFIASFSIIGVYGNMAATLDPNNANEDMSKGYPAAVTNYLGPAFYSVINIIFITSSIGTVDSTFSCTAKLLGPELCGFINRGRPNKLSDAKSVHMWIGRVAVVFMAIVGILPLLHDNQKALNATTQTGTILSGLGPPLLFLVDIEGYRPLCFHIPFWLGVCIGVVYAMTDSNNDINTSRLVNIENLSIGGGVYRILLGVNVLSICLSMFVFWVFTLENRIGADVDRAPITSGPGYGRAIAAYNKALKWEFELVHNPVNDEDDLDDMEIELEKCDASSSHVVEVEGATHAND